MGTKELLTCWPYNVGGECRSEGSSIIFEAKGKGAFTGGSLERSTSQFPKAARERGKEEFLYYKMGQVAGGKRRNYVACILGRGPSQPWPRKDGIESVQGGRKEKTI